jgi:putative Mg2+ transporter-C (MgtC) family protein
MHATTSDIIVRLAVAAALGAIVGLERERTEHAAGLRTHALVSLGSAMFMLVSSYGFDSVLGAHVTVDPSRVAAQVASGIGFLGAGTIIFRREIIRGLTTAASIWTIAAVGLACGGGMYIPAIATTILVLIILSALHPLEGLLYPTRRRIRISLTCAQHGFPEESVRKIIADAGAKLHRIDLRYDNEKKHDRIELVLRQTPDQAVAVIENLRSLEGVREVQTSFEGSTR